MCCDAASRRRRRVETKNRGLPGAVGSGDFAGFSRARPRGRAVHRLGLAGRDRLRGPLAADPAALPGRLDGRSSNGTGPPARCGGHRSVVAVPIPVRAVASLEKDRLRQGDPQGPMGCKPRRRVIAGRKRRRVQLRRAAGLRRAADLAPDRVSAHLKRGMHLTALGRLVGVEETRHLASLVPDDACCRDCGVHVLASGSPRVHLRVP